MNATVPAPAAELAEAGSPQPAATSRPGSWRRNIGWTLTGNIVYALSQWAMLMAIAKVGNERMVGQFALGLAVTAPIVILARLGLRGVQGTDVGGEYRFGSYLALRLIMMTIAFAGVTIFAAVGGYDAETALVIIAVCAAKAAEGISDVYYGLFQKHHRLDLMGRSMVLKGAISVPALVAGVVLTGSVVWGVVGLVIAWTAGLLAFDRARGHGLLDRSSGEARLDWRPRVLSRLGLTSLPLGLYMMLIAFNANVPRYFIEQQIGLSELGIFAALAYIVAASNQMVDAFGVVASPRLAARWIAKDRRGFNRLLLRMLTLALGAGAFAILATWLLGREVLRWAYTAEYAQHQAVFLLLVIGGAMGYLASLINYALTASRYLKLQFFVMFAATAVTAGACVLLVGEHGMVGAALAVIAGKAVQLVCSGAGILAAVRREPS